MIEATSNNLEKIKVLGYGLDYLHKKFRTSSLIGSESTANQTTGNFREILGENRQSFDTRRARLRLPATIWRK